MDTKLAEFLVLFHAEMLEAFHEILPDKINRHGEITPAYTAFNARGGVNHLNKKGERTFARMGGAGITLQEVTDIFRNKQTPDKTIKMSLTINIHSMVSAVDHERLIKKSLKAIKKQLNQFNKITSYEINAKPAICLAIKEKFECVSTIEFTLFMPKFSKKLPERISFLDKQFLSFMKSHLD